MKTAIIVLNWNGRNLLEEFLPSVVTNANGATVYVADNASTDDSLGFLSKNFPQVKIIRNATNGGYAKGYNDAIKSGIPEDLLILLNSDVNTPENWLEPLVEAFKTDPKLGAAQSKILDYRNPELFEYAGAGGGFVDTLGYPYCRGRIFQAMEKDLGQYNDTCDIDWASGAALAVRKSIFEELGGFDERFFAHQEEIDLCLRISARGYMVKHIGASRVFHLGGATLDSMSPQKSYLNFRNSLFVLLKNTPGGRAFLLIFLRMLLDGVAGIHLLISGKPGHFWAILRAHGSFYRQLPHFLRVRKQTVKQKRKITVFSIVWEHFIKGVKRYRNL
ncbi:MAG: glycosyltransferase family 2 protein [Leeuwenhoekiella sp.]